jgi:hypothetical protein
MGATSKSSRAIWRGRTSPVWTFISLDRGFIQVGFIGHFKLTTLIAARGRNNFIFDDDIQEVGDVVLCRVAGNEYLHIVKAIQHVTGGIAANITNIALRVGSRVTTATKRITRGMRVYPRGRRRQFASPTSH